GRKALRRGTLAQAVLLFARGVYAVEKSHPVAIDGLLDAVDFGEVDSGAHNHADYQAKSRGCGRTWSFTSWRPVPGWVPPPRNAFVFAARVGRPAKGCLQWAALDCGG